MLGTYAEIRAAVADWLNKAGQAALVERIEDFIELGQRRLMRGLRIPPMEVVVTLSVDSAGDAVIPTDYLETKELIAQTSTNAWALNRTTFAEVLKARLNPNTCDPTVFDTAAGTFKIGSIPVASEVFTLVYYKEIEFISSTVSDNWFSSYAPELILFAALSEAALYAKDTDSAKLYELKLKDSVAGLDKQKLQGEHSGSPLAVRLA